MHAKLDITITCRGRKIVIKIEAKGNTIPIVSSDSAQKLIKSSLFAYFICVRSPPPFNSSLSQEVQVNNLNVSNDNLHNDTCKVEVESYLKQYKDCFSYELPSKLPLVHNEDDHRIDLIPGSKNPHASPRPLGQKDKVVT